jgi:hypothetical protein
MASYTITTNSNLDSVNGGAWANGDDITINNGAVLTVDSNQTKYLKFVRINNGKLLITNSSTSTPIRFGLGRTTGSTTNYIDITSGLGTFEVVGNWISLGTGNGGSGQTFTSPHTGYVGAIWVETAPGSGVYEIWANSDYCGDNHYNGTGLRKNLKNFSTGDYGKVFKQDWTATSGYSTSGLSSQQWGTTLTVGDGLNGLTIPFGCNVRIPNILCMDYTASNLQTATHTNLFRVGYNGSSDVGLNGGSFIVNTALMDISANVTQSKTTTLTDCAFTYEPLIVSECYDLNVNRVCFGTYPTRWYYASSTWSRREYESTTGLIQTFSYISDAVIQNSVWANYQHLETLGSANVSASDQQRITYSNNVTVTDCVFLQTRLRRGIGGLLLQGVTNSTITGISLSMGMLKMTDCLAVTVDGYEYSEKLTKCCNSYMAANARIYNFPNGTALADGTKYYCKIRNYYSFFSNRDSDPTEYVDSPEFEVTTYLAPSENHPYRLSVIPGNASVVLTLWRRDPTYATINYEVYRSTTAGFPERDATTKVFSGTSADSNGLVTLTDGASRTGGWLLTQPANGTTYYYVLRKYDSVSTYTESDEFVATPFADPTVTNLCLQSRDFTSASWTKTTMTPTANQRRSVLDTLNSNTGSADTLTSSGSNATVTQAIACSASTQYTFSVYLSLLNNAAANLSRTVRIQVTDNGGGSSTNDVVITNYHQKFSVTHTTAVGATSATVQIGGNNTLSSGVAIFASDATFNTGSTAIVSINTTTTSAGLTPAYRKFSSLAAVTKGGVPSIEVNLAAAPTGSQYSDIHISTSPGFTISPTNKVMTTEYDSLTPMTNHTAFRLTRCNNCLIKNFTLAHPAYNDTSSEGILYLDNCISNKFIGFTANVNGGSSIIANCINLSNNNLFHNFDLSGFKSGWTTIGSTPGGIDHITIPNNNTGNVFQNIKINSGYDAPLGKTTGFQGINAIIKGKSAGNSVLPFGTASGLIPLGQAYDGVGTGYTTVYDTNFLELYTGTTEGMLHLLFNASNKTSPPYSITSGTPTFNQTGGLTMFVEGDQIVFTHPHKIIGISGFRNIDPVVSTTAMGTNTSIGLIVKREFAIDTGSGYGAWTEMTGANLNAVSVSATTGFYIKYRFTALKGLNFDGKSTDFVVGETVNGQTSSATGVIEKVEYGNPASTTGCITMTSITGTFVDNENIRSGATVRAVVNMPTAGVAYLPSAIAGSLINGIRIYTNVDQSALYPTLVVPVEITGVVAGTNMGIYRDSDNSFRNDGTESGGEINTTTDWDTDYNAILRIRRGGYQPIEQLATIVETGYSTPVAQTDWSTIPNTDPGAMSITVTNHGASPVTWNSKDFSITITATGGETATQIAQYIHWNIAKNDTFNGFRGFSWPTMIVPEGTGFATERGELYGSAGATYKGIRVVDGSGDPITGFSKMMADDGTYWNSPVTGTVANANILNGSRVRLYNVTTATEIENVVLSSAGYSYVYLSGPTINSGDTIQVRATKLGYLPLSMTGVASSSGVSFIDSQLVDDVYTSNAIDGSTVTEFVADYANVLVDINDGDGDTNVQRLYAWYQHNLTSADGIRDFFGGLTADDLVNYKINVATLDLTLNNINVSPVKITGGRLYRSDATTVISATSNSIQLDPDKVYAISTGGSALTTAEHNRLFDTATKTQGNTIISLSAAAVAK